MVSSLQNADEASKWCTYCDTLPLARKDLVREKYVLMLVIIAAAVIVLIVLRTAAGLLGFGPGVRGLGVIVLSMIMAGLLSSSITLATAFVFGPQHSQVMRLIVVVVMVGACMAIINYVPGFMDWLMSLSPILLLCLSIVIPSLFAFASFLISCAGFERRTLI